MPSLSGGQKLPILAKAYIAAIILGGMEVAALYALHPGVGWPDPSMGGLELAIVAVLFLVGSFLAETYPIRLHTNRFFDDGGEELVVSSSLYIASLLLFGPAFTLVIAALAVLLADLRLGKALYKAGFNAAQNVITVGVSGFILVFIGTNPYSFQHYINSPQGVLILFGTCLAFFMLNSSLVAGVVSIIDGVRFMDVWRDSNRHMLPQYAGMLNVGIVAAVLWTVTPVALVLLLLPIMIVHLAFDSSARLRSETTKALVAIAGMVDSRDSYTYQHSQEVARYATQIATKLGLPFEQVEMINLAAQLHDIGKIGTPDGILQKPGRLEGSEVKVMQEHPSAGAQVLKYFSLFRRGVDLVLYHQEHYDGSGYPKGLSREQVPLGARIIHVADAYQAMTSDRVYRRAMDVNVAVARLLVDSGRQFDPTVVKAFIEVLRETDVRLDHATFERAVSQLLLARIS